MFIENYNFKQLKIIIKSTARSKNPFFLFRFFLLPTFKWLYDKVAPEPDFLMEKEWDVLILLDACRYDSFSRYNTIPGRLTKIISPGSTTPEWFKNNFSLKYNKKDTIYFSSNPFISSYFCKKELGHSPFYKIIDIWKDGWNEELGTVHPQTVNSFVKKIRLVYPNKKMIIHYMQPHYPFIGDYRIDLEKVYLQKFSNIPSNSFAAKNFWNLLMEKAINVKEAYRAYISNLQLVLDYVNKLLPYLSGKICITADHGNAFGRGGIFYGHPSYHLKLPELIEVPWFEVSNRYES